MKDKDKDDIAEGCGCLIWFIIAMILCDILFFDGAIKHYFGF